MSHTKEEEEIEDIRCILDHVKILYKDINTINYQLTRAIEMTSKTTVVEYLEKSLLESKKIVERIDYMLKDLKGESK